MLPSSSDLETIIIHTGKLINDYQLNNEERIWFSSNSGLISRIGSSQQ